MFQVNELEAEPYGGVDLITITNGILEQLDYKYHNSLSASEPFNQELMRKC
jgi:hypothetical protein